MPRHPQVFRDTHTGRCDLELSVLTPGSGSAVPAQFARRPVTVKLFRNLVPGTEHALRNASLRNACVTKTRAVRDTFAVSQDFAGTLLGFLGHSVHFSVLEHNVLLQCSRTRATHMLVLSTRMMEAVASDPSCARNKSSSLRYRRCDPSRGHRR